MDPGFARRKVAHYDINCNIGENCGLVGPYYWSYVEDVNVGVESTTVIHRPKPALLLSEQDWTLHPT